MKERIKANHICYDGYKADYASLRSSITIDAIARVVADRYFIDRYRIYNFPCFGNTNRRLDGTSVVVLGRGKHFTLHTFSEIGAFFADFFSEDVSNANDIVEIIKPRLHPSQESLCNEGRPGNFGRHLVFKRTAVNLEAAQKMVQEIMATINMHPLGRTIWMGSDNEYDLIQPIQESHIAVHTKDGRSEIDIFSCRYFDDTEIWNIIGAKPQQEIPRGIYLSPDWND